MMNKVQGEEDTATDDVKRGSNILEEYPNCIFSRISLRTDFIEYFHF